MTNESLKKAGGLAFPAGVAVTADGIISSVDFQFGAGMTLRDYFAAQALPMLNLMDWSPDQVAVYVYGVADAMLKARVAG